MKKQTKDKLVLVRITSQLHIALMKAGLNKAEICRKALEHAVFFNKHYITISRKQYLRRK